MVMRTPSTAWMRGPEPLSNETARSLTRTRGLDSLRILLFSVVMSFAPQRTQRSQRKTRAIGVAEAELVVVQTHSESAFLRALCVLCGENSDPGLLELGVDRVAEGFADEVVGEDGKED